MSLTSKIKKAFWKIQDSGYEVLHEVSEKPFEDFPSDFNDPRVSEAVSVHNRKWFHNEVVVRVKDAIVEPQYAYAVDGLRTLIGASIRTRDNLPSPLPLLRAKILGNSARPDRAILFDGSMGINYFHFVSDVLHKVYLLTNSVFLVSKRVTHNFFPFFH